MIVKVTVIPSHEWSIKQQQQQQQQAARFLVRTSTEWDVKMNMDGNR